MSRISDLNSSTVPLFTNRTFDGLYESVVEFSQINVSVDANANSTLKIYFSSDKVSDEFVETINVIYVPNIPNFYTIEPKSQYFKLTLKSLGQMSFLKLMTIYKDIPAFKDLASSSNQILANVKLDTLIAKENESIVLETEQSVKLDTLIAKDYSTATLQSAQSVKLDTLIAKDFSTATLQSAQSVKLDTLIAKDYSTATLQSTANTKLDTLIAKDFSTATLQSTANTKLDTLIAQDFSTATLQSTENTKLDTLIAKDFSTATLQSTANTKLDTLIAKDFSTVAKQDISNTKLDEIKSLFAGLATRYTQNAINGSLVSIDSNTLGIIATNSKLDILNASNSTRSLQTTGNDVLGTINTTLSGISQNGSTSALQTTSDNKLATIDTKLGTISTNTTNISLYTSRQADISYSGSYYFRPAILACALPDNGIIYGSSFGAKTLYHMHFYNCSPDDLFLFFYDSSVTSPTLPILSTYRFTIAVLKNSIYNNSDLGWYMGAGLRIGISSTPASLTAYVSALTSYLCSVSSIPF